MGIRGLSFYVSKLRDGYQKNVPLHDNRVIIDGNNFLRAFIGSLRGENDCLLGYGGNYDTYYVALVEFFWKLKRCRLEPVVIFVGTTSCQEAIFERVKLRNQEKIDRLVEFIENDYMIWRDKIPLSPLVKTTLIRCLNDLHIHHLTMDFEEDYEIVALANRWRCPIITADSDFYVYQYEPGAYVIPVWRFDVGFDIHGSYSICYLETPSYDSSDFARCHGIEKQFLALFAAVITELDEGANFLSHLPLQPTERSDEIKSLLIKIRELSDTNSLEEILDNADEYFFDEEDEDRRERIKKLVVDFSPKEPKIEYCTYLEEGEIVFKSEIRTMNGACLPDFFIRGFRASKISRYCAGVLAVRSTSLYTQLEDLDAPSVNVCTARLRAILYTILLKFDSDPDGAVDEFYRETKEIIQSSRATITDIGGQPVPSLDEIPNMGIEERLNFIYLALEVDPVVLDPIPLSSRFFVLVTRYWYEKCQPPEPFLQAIILCYLRLGPQEWKPLQLPSFSNNHWNVSRRELLNTSKRLKPSGRGFKIPPIRNTPERIQIHHKFSEWETVYSEVYRLNEIMLKPLEEVGPEQCFKGVFLFSIVWYLERFSDDSERERDIERVLGRSVYENVYKRLHEAVIGNVN